MDLATIVGFVVGLVVIVVVMIMDGGSPAELLSHPSAILLIWGGSIAATTISNSLKSIFLLPKLVLIAIMERKYPAEEAIETLTRMADKARREGLLALEEESKKVKDPFLQKGIMMVVDGVDPAQVRAILETDIEHMRARHKAGAGMFAAAGGFSPTFGIIGTVMGLISVLKQLDDPDKLAKSIAAAFLATLWGLLSANMVFLPLAAKLKVKSEEEVAYRYMLLEGIIALQAGENPRIVREKLFAFLPPAARSKAEKAEGAPAGKKAEAEG
ncbi:MAG TPA: MotA/TolQ/ExbB proton channel family protein [Anaerolineaceae bacterium]|nr:MotA/TolQ/ExbB proton channel family protein [Anaerolineaceae bacterium]